ncbi:hypothetical protein CGMCC3_g17768 [Colletotrichum fructicola]|uniref:Alkali-sensitive linkage protein 1 n=2 Tax=Colletotrichum gloeosporioides species complex TaxID=2707338 RepID=A0A7J6IDH2_COLFN|nr:uncharacterized protein CGMCC3_g17768 [Colletotrichum fructicola]KAF4474387.1 Alkali-sensitive linkage protein 1 [Colletotrichum fructicola Nara gc5]KAE9566064.1 hypothetical protein CGMCC3_g17768 [Colletotrichum fructicola]KAF4417135.1 Alkali-sensitive linkage protein 1 [Colletotrichum fructicola]KAF4417963.1 Alkali-sensitive linkage protein 1 [Colletotrichum fructicola]KAF4881553.1 Alkali-sensitive linkage protein 1 [Colletotrichum fructicola]
MKLSLLFLPCASALRGQSWTSSQCAFTGSLEVLTALPTVEPSAAASAIATGPLATSPFSTKLWPSKRGFAYNDAALIDVLVDKLTCAACAWAYNWDSTDYGLLRPTLEFVPMLWSPASEHTVRWAANVEAMISGGSTHILGFNECDRPDQCNLDAASAAVAYVKWLNPYTGRVKIGSPAISNSAAADQGLEWLSGWVSACDSLGCAYDFCVAHWYGTSVAELLKHVELVHGACRGKPVWVTEFAVNSDDENQHAAFITEAVPRLDDLEYVERYSYFMVREGRLVTGSGLSSSGQAYIAV